MSSSTSTPPSGGALLRDVTLWSRCPFFSWMNGMAQALPPFQAFLEEHLDPVHAFLRGMVGPNDADDCLQETFIAALRAYPRAHAGNLRAWVFTIARRKAIDHQRSRSRGEQPMAD